MTPTIPTSAFATDDGSADPRVTDALGAYAQGVATGSEVLQALSTSRLLVPVVAVLDELPASDAPAAEADKHSSMASVTLRRRDGTEAVLAFTCVASMQTWQPDARPVAVAAREVATTAVTSGAAALLLDPAGPRPFVVQGIELRTLAFAEQPGEDLAHDKQVLDAVRGCLEPETTVLEARLSDPVGADAEGGLRITVVVPPSIGTVAFRALVPRLTNALGADLTLRARLVGPLQVAVVPPGPMPADQVLAFRR